MLTIGRAAPGSRTAQHSFPTLQGLENWNSENHRQAQDDMIRTMFTGSDERNRSGSMAGSVYFRNTPIMPKAKPATKKPSEDKPIERTSVQAEEVLPKGIDAVRAALKRSLDFKRVATIPSETTGLTALFFKDWDTAHHAFIADLATRRNVYPALQLRLERGVWKPEPWVLTAPDIERSVGIPIDEHWLRVMLGLVTVELDRLLPDPTTAYTHELVNRPGGSTVADYPPLEMALRRIGEFISGGYTSFISDQRACEFVRCVRNV